MLKLVLLILLSALSFSFSPAQAQPFRALTEFRDANFGISFSHSPDITTDYNPHGGADRVAINLKGKLIGGLKISKPFPSSNEAEFIESGKNYFKQKFGATLVEHRLHENPGKFKFHVFKAKFSRDGTDYVTERFIHLRARRIGKDANQDFLDRTFGVFQFEFVAPSADYPTLEDHIKTIVDTFRLKENS